MNQYIVSAILLLSTANFSAAMPEVDFKYSRTFDFAYSLLKGPMVQSAWSTELEERLSEFRVTWSTYGIGLLKQTEVVAGYPFARNKITVDLTLTSRPSQSYGSILVNMRYALSSFTDNPVSFNYKSSVAYHEILHGYIENHIPKNSPLLTKYSAESDSVKNHLHLLSLEKAVYLSLNREQDLEEVIKIDSMLKNAGYKRAWQIINQNDEHKAFVEELRQS